MTHFSFLFSYSFLSNITQIQDEFVRIIPTVSEMHPERLVALSLSFRHFAEGICMLIFNLFNYKSRDEMQFAIGTVKTQLHKDVL